MSCKKEDWKTLTNEEKQGEINQLVNNYHAMERVSRGKKEGSRLWEKKKQKKDWRIGRGRRNKNKTRRKIIFKGIVLAYKMRR